MSSASPALNQFIFSRALFDTAVGRPALVGFGEKALVLAWTAADSGRVTLARAADGRTVTGNAVLPDGAIDGPALAYGNGRLHLAWTDADGVIALRTAGAGLPEVGDTPQIFGDDPLGSRDLNAPAQRFPERRSALGPALACGAGALYLAWVDAGHRLNVAMTTLPASGQRPRWSAVRLAEASAAAPALAFIDGTLHLAWSRDADRRLMLMPLSPKLRPGPATALGATSDFAPVLVKAGERLHLFWTEDDRLRRRSGRDLDRLDCDEEFALAEAGAPAACVYRGQIRLASVTADQRHPMLAALPAVGGRFRVEPPAPDAPAIAAGQYGQFIEYLCDLVPGMWADRFCDGGFCGLSQYQFAHRWAEDDRQRPWYPTGDLGAARFERRQPSGLRLALVDQSEAGVAQDGIAFGAGETCSFRCHVAGAGVVRIRLSVAGAIAAEHATALTPAGRTVELPLASPWETDDATVEIALTGPGWIELGVASLMPADAIGGWRRDVVEAVRALRPGVIRFGGSALEGLGRGDFRWRETIGPVDARRPLRAWGGLQPLAAGLEEIVQFCRLVGAEPLICARHSIGLDDPAESAREAARQVEYFNGGPDTEGGRERAANGQPQPYRIRYWQIGNEQLFRATGGKSAAGGDAASFLMIAQAMRAADPTIAILSSYIDLAGVREFLAQTAGRLDFVCPHLYLPDIEEADRRLRLVADAIADTALCIAVTEWNTTGGDEGPRRGALLGLGNGLAVARFHHLYHRHADRVAITCRSNLCNSFGAGVVQTRGRRLYRTPAWHVEARLAQTAGARPLPVAPPRHDAALDFDASLAADGSVCVSIVNGQPVDLAVRIDLAAFGTPLAASASTLADRDRALDPLAGNDFDDPERVAARPLAVAIDGSEAVLTLPALSHSIAVFGCR